jgi:DNA-binding PadR family transcriptional regulator
MKIKDKKLNLLKALYSKRFDGKYYDVETIISNFGQTSRSESYNVAKSLNDEGLIKMLATKDGTHAEITSNGVEYIEELGEESYEPSDLFEQDEKETIKIKLDEFSQRLKRIEVGQQITYDDLMDEIETLKKLLNVLGKKDWRQMLKGKLVDAGFGAVADKVFELLIETFKDDKLLNG